MIRRFFQFVFLVIAFLAALAWVNETPVGQSEWDRFWPAALLPSTQEPAVASAPREQDRPRWESDGLAAPQPQSETNPASE